MSVFDVNAHIHTPYSFSCFESVSQALDMAVSEGVKVVGINDFYTMDGYKEWKEGCAARSLFPLLGMEMISLHSDFQSNGVRVNDPGNPGRTYISGKGLAYPCILGGRQAQELAAVKKESNLQVESMCARLNAHLTACNAGFQVDFDWVAMNLTSGQTRERHLAKALRILASQNVDSEKLPEFYKNIFGGSEPKSSLSDNAALENEIRSKLLKAGGAAFVPETPSAFLPLENVKDIILAAGGIPTYPFLADDAKGNFTDFEGDLQKAADTLKSWGFNSVEFITTRNTTAVLESYSSYLEDEGFIVSFGSEHNSPSLEPLKLRTRDAAGLSEKLRKVNWRGACAIAAHQAGLDSIDAGEELIMKTI